MDLEVLLRPLTGERPCGEDMMFSREFDAMREARRFDDPSLSQGEWVIEIKEAQWGEVIAIGAQLLATRTKDLRVAVWMTEALAKTRGLAGLAEGCRLVDGLCAAFWSSIHPETDDGDMELRIGNLDWLAKQLVRLTRETPLTRSPKGRYSLIDLESARGLASLIERNPTQAETLAAEARLTLECFEAARRDTAGQYFLSTLAEAESAREAVLGLRARLDALLGDDSPAFAALLDALEEVRHTLRRYATDAGAVPSAGVPSNAVACVVGAVEAPVTAGYLRAPVGSDGPVQSREQAIRQLQEIAAFFKRTEPHSPVAYLADKAARWGSMSLHDWLRSVVKDGSALAHVEELLGVEAPRGEQAG